MSRPPEGDTRLSARVWQRHRSALEWWRCRLGLRTEAEALRAVLEALDELRARSEGADRPIRGEHR